LYDVGDALEVIVLIDGRDADAQWKAKGLPILIHDRIAY
jgi:hypothetical protein